MNKQFTVHEPFRRLVSVTQSKYKLIKKDDGSTGQGSYNLSLELLEFLKSNNVVEKITSSGNDSNIYYTLSEDIKLQLCKGVIDIIGQAYNNYNNKVLFVHTIAGEGTQKFQIKRTDHKSEDNLIWFTKLYDKNCEGSEFIIYYDSNDKTLFIDNDLHLDTSIDALNNSENDVQEIVDVDENEIREKFKNWLSDRGSYISTIKAYVSQINLASKEALEDEITYKSLFQITELDELTDVITEIRMTEKFINRMQSSHNQNSVALNQYTRFIIQLNDVSNYNSNEDYNREIFLQEVFIDDNKYDDMVALLRSKKNIILTGAPGVGKTFMAKRLAYSIIGKKENSQVELIQFHQNYSYEDFIEGYKPTEDGGFNLEKGLFYEVCKKAQNNSDKDFYLVIDEINRGNLSKIFGELLMLIESDKRGATLTLAYSKETDFTVPENLYIIGLMNTADRSLALIDYALRRRFSFVNIKPAFGTEKFNKAFNDIFDNSYNDVLTMMININNAIKDDTTLGEGFMIGHSYFCTNETDIKHILKYEIKPLIKEYWYDEDEAREKWVSEINSYINR